MIIGEFGNSVAALLRLRFLLHKWKLKGTTKGTGGSQNYRSVPSSFEKELVPVQFLKKGTSSRNELSFGQFLFLLSWLKQRSSFRNVRTVENPFWSTGYLMAHYGLAAIGGVGIVANILALAMAPFTIVNKS